MIHDYVSRITTSAKLSALRNLVDLCIWFLFLIQLWSTDGRRPESYEVGAKKQKAKPKFSPISWFICRAGCNIVRLQVYSKFFSPHTLWIKTSHNDMEDVIWRLPGGSDFF
jgi:hypothetical protein